MAGALDGIRVLDMSRHLAGPYCAMMLGDMGAEVIKVERAGVGDETRSWGPPFHGGESAYYLSSNRNKRSITVNLKDERGVEIVRALARESDVLIENLRAGRLEGMGLGYADLKALNPGLVFCSISGFGHSGPDRDLPGYDFMIQARGGFMSITGEQDGPPMKVGVAIVDIATGMFGCSAVLGALYAREKSGQGQHIDMALLDSQIALLANVGSNALCSDEIPGRWGNQHPSLVPYQAFEASDGYLALAIGNDGQWERFCNAAGVPDLVTDKRFATNPQRVVNRETLIPLLADVFREKLVDEWLSLCAKADVPAGPVNTLDKVFQDPQALHREMVKELPHSSAGTVRLAGTPLKFSDTPAEVRLPPPVLGEHTDEILRERLGYDDEAIRQFRRDGVI
jgi:formyl-CoA transferase